MKVTICRTGDDAFHVGFCLPYAALFQVEWRLEDIKTCVVGKGDIKITQPPLVISLGGMSARLRECLLETAIEDGVLHELWKGPPSAVTPEEIMQMPGFPQDIKISELYTPGPVWSSSPDKQAWTITGIEEGFTPFMIYLNKDTGKFSVGGRESPSVIDRPSLPGTVISNILPHITYPLDAVDLEAVLRILLKKKPLPAGCHSRILVEVFKNQPSHLEYLLQCLAGEDGMVSTGAGSYFYTDCGEETYQETFRLYKQYGVSPVNLPRNCVTKAQWNYMREIDYISEEEYERGWA